MAELGDGLNGYLDVQDATLRAPRLEAVSNIGIANTDPQHAFSVGSNLYVSTDSSNVLTVKGNVVTEGIKMGFLEITPSYDIAAVSNVGNITSNTIIFDNPIQGFVASGNATIGSTLTISGFRITAAAAATDDLQAITTDDLGADPPKVNAGRTPNLIHITNATRSTSSSTGALRVGDTGAPGGIGVVGNVHVGDTITTQDLSVNGEIVSNLAVNTDDLFVDIVNSRVGIGKTEPTVALDVVGAVNATGNVAVDTNTLFVDSVNNKVGVGTTEPGATLEVTGNAFVSANLEVGTNDLFVDTVNSRVGIGTTSPNVLLELSSDTGSASITPTELRLSTTTNAGDWDITNPYARLAFHTEDPTGDAPGVMASIGAVASSADGGENTRLAFFTADPHLERMCIDRYGNVGIGTTDPLETCDIHGVSRISAAYPRLDFYTTTRTGSDTWGNSTNAAGDYRIYANGDASDGAKRSLNFDYGQNSVHSSRMVINAAGNVGVGQLSPYHKLDVTGNFRATDSIGLGGAGNARAIRLTKTSTIVNNKPSVEFFFTNLAGGVNPFLVECVGYAINVSGTLSPISRRFVRVYGIDNSLTSLTTSHTQENDGNITVSFTNSTKRVRLILEDVRSYSGIYATITSFSGVI
tara:strand:+ start:2561 stop:4474 length:1914 start_codon:yes stop_codon:yes gene_type:complete